MTGALAKKLAEVMGVANRIPKRGRNDFHKYDYATEADIAEAIRAELAQRSVMLFPAITKVNREPVGEKGSVLTTLDMEFMFVDGETGESITRQWAGAGTDKEDKGLYKAMTGGEKYFLLKTFLMPTGDDPEAHTDDKKLDAKKKPEPVKAATMTPHATSSLPKLPDGVELIVKTEQLVTSADKPYWLIVLGNGETMMTWKESTGSMAEQACQDGQPVRLQVRGKYKVEGTEEELGVIQSMTLAETKKPNGAVPSAAEIFNKTVPEAERPM